MATDLVDPAAGFTLIEMIVVLAVLGIALASVVGYKPAWRGGLEAGAAELAGQLRMARSEAIARNEAVAVELDLAGRRYRVGGTVPRQLPVGMNMELLTITGERRGPMVGGIRFHPDGSSSGGRIVLEDGSKRLTVRVDWLTGRVAIGDVGR